MELRRAAPKVFADDLNFPLDDLHFAPPPPPREPASLLTWRLVDGDAENAAGPPSAHISGRGCSTLSTLMGCSSALASRRCCCEHDPAQWGVLERSKTSASQACKVSKRAQSDITLATMRSGWMSPNYTSHLFPAYLVRPAPARAGGGGREGVMHLKRGGGGGGATSKIFPSRAPPPPLATRAHGCHPAPPQAAAVETPSGDPPVDLGASSAAAPHVRGQSPPPPPLSEGGHRRHRLHPQDQQPNQAQHQMRERSNPVTSRGAGLYTYGWGGLHSAAKTLVWRRTRRRRAVGVGGNRRLPVPCRERGLQKQGGVGQPPTLRPLGWPPTGPPTWGRGRGRACGLGPWRHRPS